MFTQAERAVKLTSLQTTVLDLIGLEWQRALDIHAALRETGYRSDDVSSYYLLRALGRKGLIEASWQTLSYGSCGGRERLWRLTPLGARARGLGKTTDGEDD